ncbi:MAG: 23S rRNA (guanosine(2251)-2'-O)-methyltransferase RlmB [Clostridia bacterium]|nr:23S rRNA (guanosine(2251)-2'-O)-methyltransferase RlmB [Clostridia bacterium]
MERIQIEGKNPIMEALKSGKKLERLYIQDGVDSRKIGDIVALAKQGKAVIEYVPKHRLEAMAQSTAHQGLIAILPEVAYSEFEEMVDAALKESDSPLFIMLDEIQDPHNLGAIIRSSECAGAAGLIVPARRSAPLSSTAYKASAGAMAYMPIARVTNLTDAINYMKSKNIWVIGADAEGEVCYNADLTGALALVIGSEGEGIRRLVKENCDRVVSIPMTGNINSLNASVAAGILIFESVRQRTNKG